MCVYLLSFALVVFDVMCCHVFTTVIFRILFPCGKDQAHSRDDGDKRLCRLQLQGRAGGGCLPFLNFSLSKQTTADVIDGILNDSHGVTLTTTLRILHTHKHPPSHQCTERACLYPLLTPLQSCKPYCA